jgi:hypothetical protein
MNVAGAGYVLIETNTALKKSHAISFFGFSHPDIAESWSRYDKFNHGVIERATYRTIACSTPAEVRLARK